MPKIKLSDFLLHHTQARELCAITMGGWINATFFIDHEDLFIHYLHPDLREKTVKSERWETLPIVDQSGKSVDVPCHFIEVG